MIEQAFFNICKDAEPAKSAYVSLYVSVPFYGGPEEGGWWGSDTHLVASERFETIEAAELAAEKVEELAKSLSEQSKEAFYDQCRSECEWLDARGLDADYLPEPDGESTYRVVVEDTKGSQVYSDCRHYEQGGGGNNPPKNYCYPCNRLVL